MSPQRLPAAPPRATLAQLTERLLASYDRAGGINHVDGKNLPSKHAIADIAADLLRLLFPGFFDEKLIYSSEIKAVTTALLASVLARLENEMDVEEGCTLQMLADGRLRREFCGAPSSLGPTALATLQGQFALE